MTFKINSLYLCVHDMGRAVSFYEDFFETKVAVFDEIYSVFLIGGFRLGLFAFEKMKEPHTFGSNCLVSISSENLLCMKKKLCGKTVVFPIKIIGKNYVAEFLDSEGNRLELTAPVENGKSALIK